MAMVNHREKLSLQTVSPFGIPKELKPRTRARGIKPLSVGPERINDSNLPYINRIQSPLTFPWKARQITARMELGTKIIQPTAMEILGSHNHPLTSKTRMHLRTTITKATGFNRITRITPRNSTQAIGTMDSTTGSIGLEMDRHLLHLRKLVTTAADGIDRIRHEYQVI